MYKICSLPCPGACSCSFLWSLPPGQTTSQHSTKIFPVHAFHESTWGREIWSTTTSGGSKSSPNGWLKQMRQIFDPFSQFPVQGIHGNRKKGPDLQLRILHRKHWRSIFRKFLVKGTDGKFCRLNRHARWKFPLSPQRACPEHHHPVEIRSSTLEEPAHPWVLVDPKRCKDRFLGNLETSIVCILELLASCCKWICKAILSVSSFFNLFEHLQQTMFRTTYVYLSHHPPSTHPHNRLAIDPKKGSFKWGYLLQSGPNTLVIEVHNCTVHKVTNDQWQLLPTTCEKK